MANLVNDRNIALPYDKAEYYGNVDGLSLQVVFYTRNQCFPSCYLFTTNKMTANGYMFDVPAIYSHINEIMGDDERIEIVPYYVKEIGTDKDYVNMSLNVILDKSQIYVRIERSVDESYILFKNDSIDKVQEIITRLLDYCQPPKNESSKYSRIARTREGFTLVDGRVKCPDGFDVTKLYNDSFIKEDEKIQAFINMDDCGGLVILHGDKGTGKSSYIKYLIEMHRNKRFVFVPSTFVDIIGTPEFATYLSTLNNSIIILEDCENVLRDRRVNTMSSGVSLLLNMTDGLLSDDLGIKFICTFNDDMRNIDPALLRKGRLVSKYKFEALEPQKANALLKERGIKDEVTKPLSLAEIFYYNDDNYENEKRNII